jgi:hypothetical protein
MGVHTKFICCNCKIETVRVNSHGKYCSNKCQHEYQIAQRIQKWKQGAKIHKNTLKRYLSEKRKGCWICGITEWRDKPIVLELEHIDGNSENNSEDNLSLICPNCHSQTDTYKGKNKGNGRHSRRIRYREGKSF